MANFTVVVASSLLARQHSKWNRTFSLQVDERNAIHNRSPGDASVIEMRVKDRATLSSCQAESVQHSQLFFGLKGEEVIMVIKCCRRE